MQHQTFSMPFKRHHHTVACKIHFCATGVYQIIIFKARSVTFAQQGKVPYKKQLDFAFKWQPGLSQLYTRRIKMMMGSTLVNYVFWTRKHGRWYTIYATRTARLRKQRHGGENNKQQTTIMEPGCIDILPKLSRTRMLISKLIIGREAAAAVWFRDQLCLA